MSKQLTDIGGVCPNCGADDKWLELDRHLVGGTKYDYFYSLECQGEIRHDPSDDEEFGQIETCNHHRDITICEEPEYNPEDAPDFFDD